ncbi:hypothetical protein [Streptomyces zaomyceticus]|uniref:hypothetical protein n=1 Tax=Streptomyces zaomyceticus TaxID=68286 RepID=UPI00343B3C53
MAELRGPKTLVLQITAVVRDPGGFLTVSGHFENEGTTSLVIPSALRGDETAILKHGSSLGGATLVDPEGKKRYYVLRDTDGRPLTTTGLTTLAAGRTTPVFMQFPAPPPNAVRLVLHVPTFTAGIVEVSE